MTHRLPSELRDTLAANVVRAARRAEQRQGLQAVQLLHAATGVTMPVDDYTEHFEERFWKIGEPGFWKLERRQHFVEPNDDSWQAFNDGDWNAALERLEARRPALTDHYARITDAQFVTRRVRIVEDVLTPYMQWEMHLLHLRQTLGGHTRVIRASDVEQFEQAGQLPEIIILGDETMYEILYDADGLQEGGTLYTDPELIQTWRAFIGYLYGVGEPVTEYFERDVATLPPPENAASSARTDATQKEDTN